MMRSRSLTSEIRDRAVAFFDRRAGAAMRRGGRGRGSQRTKDKYLYALSNLSAANYYATQSGGGEPGDAAGFGEAVMWITTSLAPTAAEMLVDRYSSNTGHCLYTQSGVDVFGAFGTGSTTVSTPSHRLTATDVGRIQVAASYWDGTKARLWTRRAQQGDGTALASYAPFSGATAIGSRRGGLPAVNQQIISVVQWRGVPTQAALESFFDEARRLGELPTKLQGCVVTHKWPDPKLLKSLVAPATIPDVITGASADAMGKTGAPTVVAIDTTRDGRRLLGAQGFSLVNFLQAQIAGIRGTGSGLWFATLLRPDAAMASGKHVVNCFNAPTANSGYALTEAANALNVSAFNAGGAFVGAVVSIPTTAADIGQPLPVLVNFDGATWSAYARDGTLVASAAGSLKPNTTTPMRIGLRADNGTEPLDNASFFQLMGGDVALTPAEVAQIWADYKATGRFVRAPKAEHFYDLTFDCLPTESVPEVIQDRVGTDHLTREGTRVRTKDGIRSVGPHSTTDFWKTGLGGGIAGAASGLHLVLDLVWMRNNTADETLWRYGAGNLGSFFDVLSGGRFRGAIAGVAFSSVVTLPQSEIGKRVRIVFQKTASVMQLWVNGVQGADVAAAGYAAAGAVPFYLGVGGAATGASSFSVELLEGGNTVLTSGEVAALFADMTQPAPEIPGKTQKRWVWEAAIAAANGAVPATVPESKASATVDTLTLTTSPLQLAQRTERVYSYETTPILSGAQTFSPSDYLTHPDALRASTGDWHFLLFWWLLSQQTSMGSASRVLLGDGVSGAGWGCYTSGFNSSLILYGTSAAGANVNAPVVTLPAADVGKLHVTAGGYDAAAGKLRLLHKRVEQGTGSAISGFLPGSSPSYVGRSAGGQPSNTGLAIVGWSFGQTPLSLAEYQAACDAIMAGEDIVSAPGRTQGLWSLKQDRIDTSATVQDRVGSKHFSRVGQPTLASAYARAWSW